MRGNVRKYVPQCAYPQNLVIGDGNVVLAVLLGAAVYVHRAQMGVSEWFYILSAMGGLLVVHSVLCRQRLLSATVHSSVTLLAAAQRGARLAQRVPTARELCSVCGSF